MEKFKELGIPFAALLVFFFFQSMGKMSELAITVFIVLAMTGTWIVKYHNREWILSLVGLGFGILIEVGFRVFGYQQVWVNASFFGVPCWLPIVWGFGFVIITRLGIFILKIKQVE